MVLLLQPEKTIHLNVFNASRDTNILSRFNKCYSKKTHEFELESIDFCLLTLMRTCGCTLEMPKMLDGV